MMANHGWMWPKLCLIYIDVFRSCTDFMLLMLSSPGYVTSCYFSFESAAHAAAAAPTWDGWWWVGCFGPGNPPSPACPAAVTVMGLSINLSCNIIAVFTDFVTPFMKSFLIDRWNLLDASISLCELVPDIFVVLVTTISPKMNDLVRM